MFFFLRVPIGFCDLVQVLAHHAFGPVGVARGDGVVDLLVRAAGDELLPGRAKGDGPLLGQPRGDGFVDGGEDRVARNDRQYVVKGDVRPLERIEVVERQPVGVERPLELGQVRLGGVRGRVAREAGLEEDPRLLEVADPVRRRQEMTRRPGERFENDLGRRLGDPRPLAAVDRHQPHLLQRKQRLAHGRSADAELLHQLALGRQLVARQILAFVDHHLEAAGDLLVEPTAADDADGGWYTYHTSGW